ncbi:MAG: NapC/NirT family cytochrome c [Desulfobacterales bacterium]
MTYYTMVRTSTPEFCASCHEIQFAYNTWKTSTHVNNAQGSWRTAWTAICRPLTTRSIFST